MDTLPTVQLVYSHKVRTLLIIIFCLTLAACSKPTDTDSAAAQAGDGFALLYAVTSQQQNVDKLMWVKDPGPGVKAWIDDIALFNQQVTAELERWQKAGQADLDTLGLPPAEMLARERATRRTTGELLFSENISLRVSLIVAQLKALGYCADLCYAITEESKNDEVRDVAAKWDKRFAELNTQGMALLEGEPAPTPESESEDASKPGALSPTQPRK